MTKTRELKINLEMSTLEKFKKEMKKKSFMKDLKKVIKEGSVDGLDVMTATTSLLTWLTVESRTSKQRDLVKPYVEKVWRQLNEMTYSNKFNVQFLNEFLREVGWVR